MAALGEDSMDELIQIKTESKADNQKTEREKLLEGVLKTPYEQMLLKLKLVDNSSTEKYLPGIQLTKIVRMPGDVGPVGPVGRIEDLID